MAIKWGTDSKVRMFDPASGLHVELGACGQFSLRVSNSRKFILKVVGTADSFSQSEVFGDSADKGKSYGTNSAVTHFKALIISKVKTFLAKSIKDNGINILEVDEHTDAISANLKVQINEVLDEYGLTMPEFYITSIMTPDNDPDFITLKRQYAQKTLKVRQEEILKAEAEAAQARKIVEAQTEAQIKLVGAQGEAEALKFKGFAEAEVYKAQAFAEAEEMKAKGYTYQQETSRQVGLEAMKHGIAGEGGGGTGMLGDIAGLGVALGTMGGVVNMTKEAISPIVDGASQIGGAVMNGVSANADAWDCVCGQKVTGNFCSNCGAKKPEAPKGWDCACGCKGITGNFCSNCGAKRPEVPSTWKCACGQEVTGNFCSNCGAKKAEE